jgi:hypothetical protein
MNRKEEKYLENLIKKTIIQESLFTGISNVAQGLKGVWRGEGYDYFKYVNTLKKITQELKKLDAPNHKIMTKLFDLKNKIVSSKMSQGKKDNLTNPIDRAISHFNAYADFINQIETAASQKLD